MAERGGAIHGAVDADFHPVSQFHMADLGDFSYAFFRSDETEALASDDRSGLEYAALAEDAARHEDGVRIQSTAVSITQSSPT